MKKVFFIDDEAILNQEISSAYFTQDINARLGKSEAVSPFTGYRGSALDGKIGFAEMLGKRNNSKKGGQQDAMSITTQVAEFPSDEAQVPEFFAAQTAQIVQHLDYSLTTGVLESGGSTLISAVVTPKKIWISNLGDCSALLVTDSKTSYSIERLNELDNLSNESELQRVQEVMQENPSLSSEGFGISYGGKQLEQLKIDILHNLNQCKTAEVVNQFLIRFKQWAVGLRGDDPNKRKIIKFIDSFELLFEQLLLQRIGKEEGEAAKLLSEFLTNITRGVEEFFNQFPKSLKARVNSVDWCLAVSAGLADKSYRNLVRRTPKVTSKERATQKRQWLVLACDGFLEVMKPGDVNAFIAENNHLSAEEVADGLMRLAYAKGSHDNISVIVVPLHQLPEDSVVQCNIADAHGKNAHLISQAACDHLEVLAAGYLTQFQAKLKNELKRIKDNWPPDYKDVPSGLQSVMQGIYQWLIDNPAEIATLSVTKPLRFAAAKEGMPNPQNPKYPFLITIHLTVDETDNVHLVFDPNSKFSPNPAFDKEVESKRAEKKHDALKSDREVASERKEKKGEKSKKLFKKKIRGVGAQKQVRDTWTFNSGKQRLEASVASVVKGTKAIEQLDKAQDFALAEKDNPLLMRSRPGVKYQGHDSKNPDQPKAINFAPRAQGTLQDLIHAMEGQTEEESEADQITLKGVINIINIKEPNFPQLLQMCYVVIGSVALLHLNGKMHRDVKPSNFLLFASDKNFDLRLNDYDMGIEIKNSETRKEEGGTYGYWAYDRPSFKPLIQAHNDVLSGITNDQDLAYLEWVKVQRNMNSDDFAEGYMKYRVNRVAGRAFPSEKISSNQKAIDIIISKEQPIACGTSNNPKGEVWAVCQTLLELLDAFKEIIGDNTNISKELAKFCSLMTTNLDKPEAERMDAITLFNAFDDLVKKWLKSASENELETFTEVWPLIEEIKLKVSKLELIQELEAYKAKREACKKDYYGIQSYGRFFEGFSKKQKIDASAALIECLKSSDKNLAGEHLGALLDESVFQKGLRTIVNRERYRDIVAPILHKAAVELESRSRILGT